MKKSLLSLLALGLASSSAARAATVTFGAVPTARQVVASDGVTIVTTGLVWVGTFGNESFTYDPNASVQANVSSITAGGGWYRFGHDASATPTNHGSAANAGATNTITISATGRIGGSVTDNSSGAAKADFFNGDSLYLWVFNAATVEASTEFGIFRATEAIVPWLFPTNAGGIGDAVTLSTTGTGAETIAAIGGAGSTTSSQLRLVSAVPEPSAFLLGGLGALGLLTRRRRGTAVLAAGVLAAQPALAQQDKPNSPLGFITHTIAGGGSPASPRISVISPVLTHPVVWQGAIASVSGNTLQVSGNPWSAGQFNGANGDHYVEIVSHANSGAISDIVSTSAGAAPAGSSIVTHDNLAAFAAAGKPIKIRKHVTLADFFGSANEAGLLASDDPSTADEVLVYDGASALAYFYYSGSPGFPEGWYDSAFELEPGAAASVPIGPHQAVVVKRKAAAPVSFRFRGEAKVRSTLLPVRPGLNVVGTVSAGGLTLGGSGLFTGAPENGLSSSDDPSTGDEVTLYTAGGPASYFYFSGVPGFPAGWYDSGFLLAPGEAETIPIPPGSGIAIQRKSGPAFNWSQPSPQSY